LLTVSVPLSEAPLCVRFPPRTNDELLMLRAGAVEVAVNAQFPCVKAVFRVVLPQPTSESDRAPATAASATNFRKPENFIIPPWTGTCLFGHVLVEPFQPEAVMLGRLRM